MNDLEISLFVYSLIKFKYLTLALGMSFNYKLNLCYKMSI